MEFSIIKTILWGFQLFMLFSIMFNWPFKVFKLFAYLSIILFYDSIASHTYIIQHWIFSWSQFINKFKLTDDHLVYFWVDCGLKIWNKNFVAKCLCYNIIDLGFIKSNSIKILQLLNDMMSEFKPKILNVITITSTNELVEYFLIRLVVHSLCFEVLFCINCNLLMCYIRYELHTCYESIFLLFIKYQI